MKPRTFGTFSYLSLAAVFSVLFLTLPGTAFASGFVTVGSEMYRPDPSVLVQQDNKILVHMERDRSYSCTVFGVDLGFEINGPAGSTPVIRDSGEITPHVTAVGDVSDNRVSIIPDTSALHTINVTSVTPGGESNVQANCKETSLYGGFNTNANPYNFLELTNITDSEIKGFITATNFAGAVVIDKASFSVTPNNRADFDLHTAAGLGQFGSVMISHDGPYGALQGYVSQYRAGDSGLELSTSLKLSPRDQ